MGPIDPVGFTGVQAGRSTNAAELGGPNDLTRSSAGALGAPTRPIGEVEGALGQLIRNLGGAALDEKTFQMLIGLIILLAILEQLQGGSSPQAALAPLGQGGELSQFGAVTLSQTSIQIEQSSTTIAFYATEAYTAGTNGDGSDDSTIDVAA